MILNQNQQLILDICNKFGTIRTEQILMYLNGKFTRVYLYKILSELESLELIEKVKIRKYNVIRITNEGNKLGTFVMQNMYKLNLSLIEHQLLTNEFIISNYINLLKRDNVNNLEILSEREIVFEGIQKFFDKEYKSQQRKLIDSLTQSVPDGLIKFELNDREHAIAVEMELNQKYKPRYVSKLNDYRQSVLNNKYTQITYICRTTAIKNKIQDVMTEENIELPIRFILEQELGGN